MVRQILFFVMMTASTAALGACGESAPSATPWDLQPTTTDSLPETGPVSELAGTTWFHYSMDWRDYAHYSAFEADGNMTSWWSVSRRSGETESVSPGSYEVVTPGVLQTSRPLEGSRTKVERRTLAVMDWKTFHSTAEGSPPEAPDPERRVLSSRVFMRTSPTTFRHIRSDRWETPDGQDSPRNSRRSIELRFNPAPSASGNACRMTITMEAVISVEVRDEETGGPALEPREIDETFAVECVRKFDDELGLHRVHPRRATTASELAEFWESLVESRLGERWRRDYSPALAFVPDFYFSGANPDHLVVGRVSNAQTEFYAPGVRPPSHRPNND